VPILLYTMASQQTLERGHGRGLGLVGRSARERTTDLRKKESAIRRKTTRSSGRRPCWNDDDFDVVANDEVVGRIFKAGVSVARPWMWTLIFLKIERQCTGYAVTREAAMAAFAKSLRLEYGVPRLTGQ
jgi:hypothetical protein